MIVPRILRHCMRMVRHGCVERNFIGGGCSRARRGPGGYIDARYRAMTAVRRGLACMCPRAMAASVARANPHSLQAGCGLRGERRRAAAPPLVNAHRGGTSGAADSRHSESTNARARSVAAWPTGSEAAARRPPKAAGQQPSSAKPCVGGVGRRCRMVEMRGEERRGEERRGAIGGPAPPWPWRVRPAPWCGVGAIRTNRTNEL